MKTFIRVLGFTIALFCLSAAVSPHVSLATIYYVDFQNGSDNNTGVSRDTPFKHCPGDTNATDKAAQVQLNLGDTILFKPGSVYKGGTIVVPFVAGNGDAITYETGFDWDPSNKERAVIDGSFRPNAVLMRGDSAQGVVIKSLAFRNAGGFQTPPPLSVCSSDVTAPDGIAISFKNSSNIKIIDCVFDRIGSQVNRPPFSQRNINGTAIDIANSSIVRIERNFIKHTGTGINITVDAGSSSQYITVILCRIGGYVLKGVNVTLAGDKAELYRLCIRDNYFSDFYKLAQCRPYGWRSCVSPDGSGEITPTAISISNKGKETNPHGISVAKNTFYNYPKAVNVGCDTVAVDLSGGIAATVHHNEIMHFGLETGAINIHGKPLKPYVVQAAVKVINNTFYSPRSLTISDVAGDGNYTVYNNIFYGTSSNDDPLVVVDSDNTSSIHFDYNCFYKEDGDNATPVVALNGVEGPLSLVDPHGFFVDPQFKDPSLNLIPKFFTQLRDAKYKSPHVIVDKTDISDIRTGIRYRYFGPGYWNVGAYYIPREDDPSYKDSDEELYYAFRTKVKISWDYNIRLRNDIAFRLYRNDVYVMDVNATRGDCNMTEYDASWFMPVNGDPDDYRSFTMQLTCDHGLDCNDTSPALYTLTAITSNGEESPKADAIVLNVAPKIKPIPRPDAKD